VDSILVGTALSSRSALEAETRLRSVCLSSGCKSMARISAVTALRSHTTFLRGVVGATYTFTASRSLVGCCVTRSLHRGALSVAIWPCDMINMLPANMVSLSGTTTQPLQRVLLSSEWLQSRQYQWVLLCAHFPGPPYVGNGRPRLEQRTPDTHTNQ